MLIDSHAHATTTTTDCIRFRPEYTVKELVNDMNCHHIEKAILMLNPMFTFFKCIEDKRHKITVQDTSTYGILRLYCTTCNKVLYEGIDPLRKFNLELLESVSAYPKRFFPMLTLSLSNSTIPHEIEFYESNFPNSFIGYKLHPRISFRSLDDITIFPSSRPILIHTGVDYPPTPTNIEFVNNYKGNILLAHAGRFDHDLLRIAKSCPNVYIDAAPSSLMFKGRVTDLVAPFNHLIQTPSDIYRYLIEQIGEDKVLFGSDVPWGNYEDEISILNSTSLPLSTYDKISHLNALKALNIE